MIVTIHRPSCPHEWSIGSAHGSQQAVAICLCVVDVVGIEGLSCCVSGAIPDVFNLVWLTPVKGGRCLCPCLHMVVVIRALFGGQALG